MQKVFWYENCFKKILTITKDDAIALASLFSLQSKIESNYNQYAIRFEKSFFDKLLDKHIKEAKQKIKLSSDTVKAILSTSFGSVQILGYNLFNMYKRNPVNSQKDFLRFLFSEYMQDVAIQCYYFYLFILEIGYNYNEIYKILKKDVVAGNDLNLIQSYAFRYNGSVSYANLLLENRKKFLSPAGLKHFFPDAYICFMQYIENLP
jgi:hypothetical protein